MDKYGMVYCYSGMRAFLQNTRYIGCAHDQDDFCEAIIPQGTFNLTQTIIAERAQRNATVKTDWVYLFTGLVFCAECGNRLAAHTVAGKYIYYRCTRHEKLHLCAHKKRTSELVLEQWLIDNLISCFIAHNMGIAARAARPVIQIDEARVRRKMEKLKDLYLNDLIDRESYERDYTALREELKAKAEHQRSLPAPVDLPAVQNALSAYATLEKQHKKEFWAKMLSKIIITNEDDFSIIPCCP